jgi:hypothetical protein
MPEFEKVRSAARGRWKAILSRLGVSAAQLSGKHTACPGCGGKDRFRFDDQDGRGTWICSGGGGTTAAGDGFDLLVHMNIAQTAKDALHIVKEEIGESNVVPLVRKKNNSETYTYCNLDGEAVLYVKRTNFENGEKTFEQWLPSGANPSSDPEREIVPYHLERWHDEQTIFVCEGEKCVHAVEGLGLFATCNAGGANAWKEEHAVYLSNKDVIILPDNDLAGMRFASTVALTCLDIGVNSVKSVALPGLGEGEDIADWVARGGTQDSLIELCDDSDSVDIMTNFKWCTLEDLVQREATPWLIPGYLPESTLCSVYGAPGSYKTFLCLDMMLRLAHGMPFLDNALERGLVVYIAGEGAGGLRKRVLAWHDFHQKDVADAAFLLVEQAVAIRDSEMLDALIDDIEVQREGQEVKAIVFDTLARCMSGDENSATDMGEAVQSLDSIKERFKCCVVAVHHSGKDASRGLRGSSALLGALDVALQCRKDGDVLELRSQKQKDFEPAEPTWFQAKAHSFQVHAFEDESSLVLSSLEAQPVRGINISAKQRTMLQALSECVASIGATDDAACQGKTSEPVVTVKAWMENAIAKGISNGKRESEERAFRVIKQQLRDMKLVGQWKERAWILRDREEDSVAF